MPNLCNQSDARFDHSSKSSHSSPHRVWPAARSLRIQSHSKSSRNFFRCFLFLFSHFLPLGIEVLVQPQAPPRASRAFQARLFTHHWQGLTTPHTDETKATGPIIYSSHYDAANTALEQPKLELSSPHSTNKAYTILGSSLRVLDRLSRGDVGRNSTPSSAL